MTYSWTVTVRNVATNIVGRGTYLQEQLERKKAESVEKLKNATAAVHKAAEEKRATAEARHGEEIVAAEEAAAKYHAMGEAPKKLFAALSRG